MSRLKPRGDQNGRKQHGNFNENQRKRNNNNKPRDRTHHENLPRERLHAHSAVYLNNAADLAIFQSENDGCHQSWPAEEAEEILHQTAVRGGFGTSSEESAFLRTHSNEDTDNMSLKGLSARLMPSLSALRRIDLETLHEFETNMISSLKNVQKVIKEKIERDKECTICRNRPKDTALIPCGHRLCSNCGWRMTRCPMCRVAIERTLKLL